MGVAAHDLKSPLNHIQSLIGLVQDEEESLEESKEYLQLISQLVNKLREVIDKVLDVTAVEQNLNMDIKPTNLLLHLQKVKSE